MLPAGGVTGEAHNTAEAIARRSYGRLVALLSARTRDVAVAEDALSDAFAQALVRWPEDGCPANPEGWLLTVARRKAVDSARRRACDDAASAQLRVLGEGVISGEDAPIPDQRLGLMFACAHPAIDPGIRAPLMLQTVLGLGAKTIAAAFLTSAEAMGKRLVRAKEKIRLAGIPLRIPEREELPARLDAVLDAVYATFAETWSDPSGTDVARLVAGLLPGKGEPLGLLALMLHAAARRSPVGEYVPFAEQDPDSWDWGAIAEAEFLIRAAAALGAGRYQLEAALQSAHVFRRRTGAANRADVVALYDALLALTASPVGRRGARAAIITGNETARLRFMVRLRAALGLSLPPV